MSNACKTIQIKLNRTLQMFVTLFNKWAKEKITSVYLYNTKQKIGIFIVLKN